MNRRLACALLCLYSSAIVIAQPAAPTVNVNTATESELAAVPVSRLGVTMARRIIDYRRVHGDFLSLNDLTLVAGMSPYLPVVRSLLSLTSSVPAATAPAAIRCTLFTRWPVLTSNFITYLSCVGPSATSIDPPRHTLIVLSTDPDSAIEAILKNLVPVNVFNTNTITITVSQATP